MKNNSQTFNSLSANSSTAKCKGPIETPLKSFIPNKAIQTFLDLIYFSQDNNSKKKPKTPFILIHGAWYTANSWRHVKRELKKKKHKVVAINLPNYKIGEENPEEITLTTYVDAVLKEIRNLPSKPILVGHSMAGIILSQLASDYPEEVEAVVYLSAFLLKDGESIKSFINKRPNNNTGAIKSLVQVKGPNGIFFDAWEVDNTTLKERF